MDTWAPYGPPLNLQDSRLFWPHDETDHTNFSMQGSRLTNTKTKYKAWLSSAGAHGIQSTTIRLKLSLERTFGVRVHSINPFINLGLEGHVFAGTPASE